MGSHGIGAISMDGVGVHVRPRQRTHRVAAGLLAASCLLVGTAAEAATILAEGFEAATPPALPQGWTTDSAGAGTTWETTAVSPLAGDSSAIVHPPDAPSDHRLATPPVAIPAGSTNTRVSFIHSFDFEVFASSACDGGVLEFSIADGGFTEVVTAGGTFTQGGYNGTVSCDLNPLLGFAAWTGHSGGVVTTIAVLPDSVAGQTIRLRWRAGTDVSGDAGDWLLDDVLIEQDNPCADPTIVGTEGDDNIDGTPGDNVIDGRGGNDTIIGKRGNDIICGGEGNDVLRGGGGKDGLFGGPGEDVLKGGRGADSLDGGEGNDVLRGGGGKDGLFGGPGEDVLKGGRGADSLDGGDDVDACKGGKGKDTITNCP